MRKIISIFTILSIVVFLSSCGGGGTKKEVLEDPQIDATINVELGHSGNMSGVALSPDGVHLASAAYDGSIIIWDYATKHQVMTFYPESSDEAGDFIELTYTSDGKYLVAGNDDYYIGIFDVDAGSLHKSIPVDYYYGKNLAVSADDKLIAAADADGIITIFDFASGSEVAKLEGHTNSVYDLEFSPDGKYLGSASYDSSAIIWDVAEGTKLKQIEADEEVVAIAFNATSDKFAFSVEDVEKVFVYDVNGFKLVSTIEEVSAEYLKFKGDDLMMKVYSDMTLYSLDGEEIKSFDCYGWDISVLGDVIATAASDGVNMYDFATGSEISIFGNDTRAVEGIEVSPSGKFIVTANSHKSGSGGPDILSYAVDTTKKFTAYGTSGSGMGLFAFAGNTDVIFSEEYYGESYYYDLSTGKSTSTIEDKVTNPFSITSDGALLVGASYDDSDIYGIFDAKTGELKTELVNNDGYLYFAGISPDDKYYVLLTMDFCKVFQIPSGNEVVSYEREDMDDIVFVDMIDGRYVVGQAEYDDFKLTDVMTGEVIFFVEDIDPTDAAFNADKNTIAIACSDWTVKVFDLAANAQTQTLSGHGATVNAVEYTNDGQYLISGGQDNRMLIWDKAGNLLLTVVGLEKMSDYEGETKDFVVFAPNGRYDGTQAGIDQFLFFDKAGERVPASTYKAECYTPNLLGRTLGQNFTDLAQ